MLNLGSDLVHMDPAKRDYRAPSREQIGYVPGKLDRASEPGVFGINGGHRHDRPKISCVAR